MKKEIIHSCENCFYEPLQPDEFPCRECVHQNGSDDNWAAADGPDPDCESCKVDL